MARSRVAVEARNLAPLSARHGGCCTAISGLIWQGLFDHGHLVTGQTVLVRRRRGHCRFDRGAARTRRREPG